jgi:hypothetical protein
MFLNQPFINNLLVGVVVVLVAEFKIKKIENILTIL